MIVISNNLTFELDGDSAVAIGKFDGVHIGHQKLVEEINHAKNNGLKAVIFTFDPPPNQFFHFTTTGELSTKEEKRKLFEQLGVDVLIEYPLTNETAMMDPVDFVQEILIKQIHAKKIVAGKDISFGYLGRSEERRVGKEC